MDEPTHRGHKLDWNLKANIICERVPDPIIRFCYVCDLPIEIYGRMLPCKHAFCIECANRSENNCPRCQELCQRVEKCEQTRLFTCFFGAPKHSRNVCGRTYLSQRDLEAHIEHRHRKPISTPIYGLEEHAVASKKQRPNTNLINIPLKRS